MLNGQMAIIEDAARLFIKMRARKLIKDSAITHPPIMAIEIARKLGIMVTQVSLEGVAALLKPCQSGLEIQIKADDPDEMKNYSCAHELMHTFFFDGEGRAFIDAVMKEKGFRASKIFEERLCEIGAAELLMPSIMFKEEAETEKHGFSIKSVESLARTFFVTIRPASIRVAEICPTPCLAIFWEPQRKSLEDTPTLRIEFATELRFRSSHNRINNTFIKPSMHTGPLIMEAYHTENFVYSLDFLKIGKLSIPCSVQSKGFLRDPWRYVVSLAFPKENYGDIM